MKTKPFGSQTSPPIIAALLEASTMVKARVFTLDTLPIEWADYPEGYAVFSTTLNIHTGEHPVAVYYKGAHDDAALGAARNTLTRAGFECRSLRKISVKRQPSIVVTAKRVS